MSGKESVQSTYVMHSPMSLADPTTVSMSRIECGMIVSLVMFVLEEDISNVTYNTWIQLAKLAVRIC